MRGPCCGPWGRNTLNWPLPGAALSYLRAHGALILNPSGFYLPINAIFSCASLLSGLFMGRTFDRLSILLISLLGSIKQLAPRLSLFYLT